jgi:hypothetical protein
MGQSCSRALCLLYPVRCRDGDGPRHHGLRAGTRSDRRLSRSDAFAQFTHAPRVRHFCEPRVCALCVVQM